MNDTVLKMYESYEKEYNNNLAKVTELYNSMWSKILESYYKDTYSIYVKSEKYYIDFPSNEILNRISPYADKLLIKLLLADGFERAAAGTTLQWCISRCKIEMLIDEYREEKNRSAGGR